MDIQTIISTTALVIASLGHIFQYFDRQRAKREKELQQDIVIEMTITIDPTGRTTPIINVLQNRHKAI